jgi:hypothetical protein
VSPDVDEISGRPDAPILLVTKLHPPFVPAQTIARERLFERLRGGIRRRLTLVACPAGFGKSTLLAAWRESVFTQVLLDHGFGSAGVAINSAPTEGVPVVRGPDRRAAHA